MDDFSLLQIIERTPELKFKYMGSYPSDKVPQLKKYSFAIVNSAPSNDRGEHWIMIARLDKTYYFADSAYSFKQTQQNSLFLSNKNVSANGSSKATKN